MSCPMTEANANKHGLTDKQIEIFCRKGCSVDCETLLEEYVNRTKQRRKEK